MTKSLFSRRTNALSPRRGFTLLEILTSVTLALTLMYAVARIFSSVGGSMNETMSSMEMSNALRNAKNRLTADLEATSASLAPPRNSRRGEGFFCYVEGMGGPFDRVASGNNGAPFAVGDVALDSERYLTPTEDFPIEEDPGPSIFARFSPAARGVDANGVWEAVDATVGDLDDILSFTAKAPDGQPFRGRFIEPVYRTAINDAGKPYQKIVDAVPTTIESEYAEIIWFVRGTTLYRRVLPLVSNERLQESFDALRISSTNEANIAATTLAGAPWNNVRRGFGFYQFYDVSVHMGEGGVLVANTLGDLSNRENRYFYWNSCGARLNPDNPSSELQKPFSPHGKNGAWYWLRMATLQESAAPSFRAGAPFGQSSLARRNDATPANAYDNWAGFDQELTLTTDGSTALEAGEYSANQLPILDKPFIDFWRSPHVWNEVDSNTGDLSLNVGDIRANGYNKSLTLNQDVALTNVVSFNVKVWDARANAYVDLGSGVQNGEAISDDPNDLRSYGRWSNYADAPFLPCVYDTWSEQYQRDLCIYADYQRATNGSNVQVNGHDVEGLIADIPLDATPTSSQLKDYPPPYDVPIKSVQIEIRVFDPRSKAIRQSTFVVDLSRI